MLASEEIFEERRQAFEEQQRILLARLMSEKGGILQKGNTTEENECKAVNFFKELAILEYKFIDVVRDDWGLDPNDDSATFGDDMDTRWDHFIQNHIVRDDEGNPTILYEDRDKRYRLIPDKTPTIKDLEFIIKNISMISIEEDLDTLNLMPTITISGINGVCSDKYETHTVSHTHSKFYLNQILIMTAECLDIIEKHKDELKADANYTLFPIIKEKVKDIFN